MKKIYLSLIFFFFTVTPTLAQTSSFRFVSWGDTKDGTTNLAPLSNQAKATNPAFTIYSGDLVPDNLSSSLLDSWKKAMNGGTSSVSDVGNGMFNLTLPVRGNHDFDNTPVWEAYFDISATVARVGGSNYQAFETDRTYSFDYGNSHFIGVDVDGDARYMTSAQIAWMDADLTAAEQRGLVHAFLYFHGPIYPVAEHSTAPINTALTAMIYKHPIVSATFHGHEHTMAYAHVDKTRVANMTGPQGDRSFEEFVTANAGVYHTYQCLKPTEYCMTGTSGSADACPWDGQYCKPPVWGFVTVDVNGPSYTVNAYRSGVTAPVKTWTFTKGVTPNPTPTPTPGPSGTPVPTASPTPRPTVTPTPTPTPPTGPTTILIKSAVSGPGDIWKYNDKGVALDSSWKNITFDDSSWSSGPSKLGYGDGNENTLVSYGPNSSSKYITTYFRKSFTLSNLSSVVGLNLKLKKDDGAVVYLNGTEVYRTNMPTGTIAFSTLAASIVEADSFETTSINPQILQSNNVLAIEVHQVSSSNSSDMQMDAELTATLNSSVPNPTPTPTPCLKQYGDADCNGVVDRNDFLVWIYEVSSLQTTRSGDFNGDGVINTGDYAIWRIKFLNITASPSPTTFPSPTPNPLPPEEPTPTPNASNKIYYLDCNLGNDTNNGLSQTTAWKSIAAVNSKLSNTSSLIPGDQLLLKRGCVYNGSLKAPWNGNSASPIIIGAYGTGTDPEINHNLDNTDGITYTGSYIQTNHIRAVATAPNVEVNCQSTPVGYMIGFRLKSTAHDIVLDNVYATGYYAGAYIEFGSKNNTIRNSTFDKNTMMHPLDTTSGNDAGAFGVLIHGSYNTIVKNTFSNHNACSYDYTNDGAAVEIYRGQNNLIAQNIASQNDTFSELGGDTTKAINNVYAYNLATSSLPNSIFMVVRGSGSGYGPTSNTKVYNNTAYLTGANSQGMICHAGCSSSILTLKNNILWAQSKSLYADAAFDESHNLYWKTGGNPTIQGSIATTSIKVDPGFVVPGSNFHLVTYSPAKDKGIPEVLNTGITKDADGISLPQGQFIDLGAYEIPLQ